MKNWVEPLEFMPNEDDVMKALKIRLKIDLTNVAELFFDDL